MVATLPSSSRTALVLTDLEGMTQREAAERSGLSLSGMKSRVQRARRQLKETFLECCRIELDRRGGIVDFSLAEVRAPSRKRGGRAGKVDEHYGRVL